jgi:membrane-bound ClpP family serine protease
MNRSAGTGFIGFGIVLVVIGAIMRFAVTATTQGFNIHTAGMIALWVGVVSFFVGLLMFVLGSHNKTTTRDSVVQTQAGAERVQESENWSL